MKQTLLSASFVASLVASVETALADPGDAPARPDEVVHPDDDSARPGASSDPAPVARTPTGEFAIGAGFSTDDGFVASASVAQSNLFDTGTQLALDAIVSARRQRFVLAWQDPTLFGTDLGLRASLYNDRRHLPGFTREATGTGWTLTHPLGPHVRAFAGYRIEQIEVTPDASTLAARTLPPSDPFRGGRLAAVRAGLEYNTLDAPYLPTRGTAVGASIEITDRQLGSQIEMMRTDAWANHHHPLGPLTLHVGGTLSTVSGGVPFSERLHFDGSRDIRGYPPGALGPADPLTGMSLGGNLKYTARGELEVPLIPRIGLSAVGFLDVGGICAGRCESAASMGFGLIWRSPIGPLRLDYAIPLDGSRPGLVFGLGASF